MLQIALRLRDGRGGGAWDKGRPDLGEYAIDPVSSSTFIASDGSTRYLRREDYQLTPRALWTSKETGGRYPIAWEIAVSSLDLKLTVTTALKDQELVLKPIVYWEGAIDCAGARSGRSMRGHGYLELTGYAGALVGLSN
jgi:predicted secreted hydrolase